MIKGPKVLNSDVLVVGGGPAGFAAAVSSAREGAKTLLVERYGFLGGMATAALVNPFMVSKDTSGDLIMSPIFGEVIGRLEENNACVRGELFSQPHIAFDPEQLKSTLLAMVSGSGVKLYLHSLCSGVIMKENRLSGIIVESKSGQLRILSKVTVDATGDADVASMSGAQFELGRPSDGLMQPATLYFRVGGVDRGKMPDRKKMDALFLNARKEGRIAFEREKLLWFETTREDELCFNVTRVTGVDGTRVEDLTRAEVEARKQVNEVFRFLRSEVPGFESSSVTATGTQIGIRETRRITGEYRLTVDDLMSGKGFDDTIAKGSYPIDVHDPKGKGTTFKPLNKPYGIPYRCLIPKKVDNLIVAGRPISVDHEAFSSTRVMPTCIAVGEVAGVAAAGAARKKISPRNVDVLEIKNSLRERGANYL